MQEHTGVEAELVREAARALAGVKTARFIMVWGVTEHSQGSTMVMGIANLAFATGNIGREGVGVNPLRGQNNVKAHVIWAASHTSYLAISMSTMSTPSVDLRQSKSSVDEAPGLRIPNMPDAAIAGEFKGMYVQGEDIAQPTRIRSVEAALKSLECLVVQDIFLNETAKFAHVLLPG